MIPAIVCCIFKNKDPDHVAGKFLKSRKLLQFLGYLLLAVSLVYIGERVITYMEELGDVGLTPSFLAAVGVGTVLYAVLLLLFAAAWGVLLGGCLYCKVRWSAIVSVYGRSQISKYLPTNVLHYAGRQVMGRAIGWPHLAIAAASVLEIIGLLLSSGIIVLGLGFALQSKLVSNIHWLYVVVGVIAIGLVLRFPPLWRLLDRVMKTAGLRHQGLKNLPWAVLLYILFFMLTSLLLFGLVSYATDTWQWVLFPRVALAFSVAWLVGYVVPGAPGGLGVREAMLQVVLSPLVGGPVATLCAIALRIITSLGDVAFYFLALVIHKMSDIGDETGEVTVARTAE